jgi:hypothetical protein
VRDLEARLLAEREEKAALVEDKAALQGRMMQLRDAGTVCVYVCVCVYLRAVYVCACLVCVEGL